MLAIVEEGTHPTDSHLLTLQQTGLIRESARSPELEYAFGQALIQEAAYQTILLKGRRLHKRVAVALEILFADRLDELAGILAHHFHEAGHLEEARYYQMHAGDAAFKPHIAAASDEQICP